MAVVEIICNRHHVISRYSRGPTGERWDLQCRCGWTILATSAEDADEHVMEHAGWIRTQTMVEAGATRAFGGKGVWVGG